MGKTRILPEQARTLEVFDDQKAPGAPLEDPTLNLEQFLGGVISQVNRLVHTVASGKDWYADLTTPTTFEGGAKRGVDPLNQALHDLERKRLLTLSQRLVDVTVPAGQNWVVLGVGELPINQTAAVGSVTTRGTVVAAHGSFGAHSLDAVTGLNSINPLNIVPLVQGNSRDALSSSGGRIYGLLQSENGADGHTIIQSAPNRVQISFVRVTATGDGLEAVPAGDIENQVVNYASVERVAFRDIHEQSFLQGAAEGGAIGTGGTGSQVRLRGISEVTTTIAAGTLIEGPGGPNAPNTSADLFDYTGLTFEGDVEVYVNGQLMRGGPTLASNFDVYPSTVSAEKVVGGFYCKFDLRSGDVLQMFAGGPLVAPPVTVKQAVTIRLGSRYTPQVAAVGVGKWCGPLANLAQMDPAQTSYGAAALPANASVRSAWPMVPSNGRIKKLIIHWGIATATMVGDIVVQRFETVDGGTSTTSTQVGTTTPINLPPAGAIFHDVQALDMPVNEGDFFQVFVRGTVLPTTTFLRVSLLIELD